jgi:hypothetical protein
VIQKTINFNFANRDYGVVFAAELITGEWLAS